MGQWRKDIRSSIFTVLRGGREGKYVDVEAKEKGELGGEMPSFVSVRSCTVAQYFLTLGGNTYTHGTITYS
jgi:hypothetical protein